MSKESQIVGKAATYIFNMVKDELPEEFTYHNYFHFAETAEAAQEIAEQYDLKDEQEEHLLLAAWFHDVGYKDAYIGHEKESARIAREFLKSENYPESGIKEVERLILSTEDHEPTDLLEEILYDADIIHIGKKGFFTKAELLRQEWLHFLKKEYTDAEWEKLQVDFLINKNFATAYGRKEYGKRRLKNIRKQLKNQKSALKSKKKKKRKEKKKEVPSRGVETMYRVTYRTHINLSSIADSKANMMISINTIILSVIITVVGGGFTIGAGGFVEHLRFILPLTILLLTCLLSVVYAVLSARPNVTTKKVDVDKIKKKKSSILFFGNFANMDLDDFIVGLQELSTSKDLLYDNMTIDLYYLGIVLTKKYQMLRTSYNLFMGGLVLCVLSFIFIFTYSQISGSFTRETDSVLDMVLPFMML